MWTSEKPDLTWNEESLCEWSWSKQSCIWTHTIIITSAKSRWLANKNCTMSSSLGKFFTNSRLGLTLRNPCFTNSRLVSAKDKSNWNVWNVALAFIWSKFDRISPILKAFRDSFFIFTKDDIIIWSYVAQMVQRYHWIEDVLVQVSNARSSCFFFLLLSSLFPLFVFSLKSKDVPTYPLNFTPAFGLDVPTYPWKKRTQLNVWYLPR